jgi:uncharacterized protein (TIGR02646 family)
MRHIKKNEEPIEIIDWKNQANEDWKPDWGYFRGHPKIETHKALLREQGFICCYCGRRISRESSHIEHFKPRKHFPQDALNYFNLLASCPGYPEDEKDNSTLKSSQEYCGQKKGDWFDVDLTVSPLIENCTNFFRYAASGEILPTEISSMRSAAQETIQRLGLNHTKLERARRTAIARLLQWVEELSDEELEMLIQSYDQPEPTTGELVPYCSAIIYQLKQFLKA